MKKLILLLVFAVFVITFSEKVAAQEELEITIIEYNPDNNFARIQILNTLPNDINNVRFQINTLPERLITPTLNSGSATARVLTIPEGTHTIKVSSDEITTIKELTFSSSIQESHQDFEEEKLARRREVQKERVIEKELEENAPIIEKKSTSTLTKVILSLVGLIILAAIAYFLLTKKKNEI
tara:strand:+ start:132 stop:677 length:546 start_codon:yes stop_codon:yes gene_type:complete